MSSDILLTTADSSAPATRTMESKFKIANGTNRVFKLLSETSQPGSHPLHCCQYTLSPSPTKQLTSIEDSVKSLGQSAKDPPKSPQPPPLPQQHVMSVTVIPHDPRTNFCPS